MKTINKFFLLLGSLALTAGMTGCEDTRGEHLDEYASRIYFRDGGNQTISLYRVGENTVYKVPVCKGGSDLSYTAEATVAAVDQAQLDIYNMNNFTNYKQIPEEYFKFVVKDENGKVIEKTIKPQKLHFASEDTYKVVEVELFTDDISFLQEADPEHEYIFALQVYSDRQVSPDINLMILKPEIEVPVVSLAAVGEKKSVSFTPTDKEATKEVTGEIVLGMDNRWNFTCTLGVRDQEWLDAYNAEHDENYVLMPDNVYELSESVLEFKEGSNTAEFKVKIKRENMGNFTKYILPLYLAECSKKNAAGQSVFDLSDEDLLFDAVFTPDPEPITLTEEMLSTPYTHEGDGIGLPGLVDGDDTSYWHSLWANMIAGDKIFGVYIDVTLDTPVTGVQFRYQTRPGNDNGVPQIIRIGASEDGVNWRMIREVSENLPTAAGAWSEYLPMGIARTPCRYFRFGVAHSAGGNCCTDPPSFTALGELQLKGI